MNNNDDSASTDIDIEVIDIEIDMLDYNDIFTPPAQYSDRIFEVPSRIDDDVDHKSDSDEAYQHLDEILRVAGLLRNDNSNGMVSLEHIRTSIRQIYGTYPVYWDKN